MYLRLTEKKTQLTLQKALMQALQLLAFSNKYSPLTLAKVILSETRPALISFMEKAPAGLLALS
jgi:hypothetical protein